MNEEQLRSLLALIDPAGVHELAAFCRRLSSPARLAVMALVAAVDAPAEAHALEPMTAEIERELWAGRMVSIEVTSQGRVVAPTPIGRLAVLAYGNLETGPPEDPADEDGP